MSDEITEWHKEVGEKEYHRQYSRIWETSKYIQKTNVRASKLNYTNNKKKLDNIKEKYKNGVSDEMISDWINSIM